jgi:MSHA biogenesis protein MshQ
VRFGRLKLTNAYGSELLNLPIPIGTEYWNATSFVPNLQDGCTSIAAGNVTLGGYLGGINGGNMSSANVSIGGAFNAGKGSLVLAKPVPRPATKGSVDITIDLATENKTYLRTGPTFSSDPAARATFGIYKRGPIIYLREMY